MHLRAIAIAACATLTCVSGVAAQPQDVAFTNRERLLLTAGRLVTRRLSLERNGRELLGGSSWQVINASSDVVWRALHDAPRYPDMLPGVSEAHMVATSGEEPIVYIRHELWPFQFSYYLTLHSEPSARTIRFALDPKRPHDVRSAWGFVRLIRQGDAKTLLAFGAFTDIGDGVIAILARRFVRAWLLQVPSTVKEFLEGGGRARYQGSGMPPP